MIIQILNKKHSTGKTNNEDLEFFEQADESGEQTFGDSVNNVRIFSHLSLNPSSSSSFSFSSTAISVVHHQITIAMI